MLGKHTCNVEGHVAVADDRNFLGLQRPFTRYVRVAVVPGNEVRGAERALKLDAGNVQIRVLDGTGRENDRVVEVAEILQCQVPPIVDVAQEADVTAVQNLVQRIDDALDPGVVRCDTVADQAVGRGILVEEVDADFEVAFGLGQNVGSVDTCRAGSDDGDPQRALLPVRN
jgi:hypothetical protein